MNEIYEKLKKCYASVRARIDFCPEVAIVLGSGIGNYAEGPNMRVVETLDYREMEGFPVSTVSGHKGRFLFGYLRGVPVVIMQGRVHYYEGYPMTDVVLPIRLMGLLGAKDLILTNAAGGLQDGMTAGDLMLITDQIGCFVPSPLIGQNIDELGTRFPDMSHIYDAKLQSKVRAAAEKLSIPLKEGTYIQLTGPNYETPAEVRMCKLLGADAVGMSTACEAIAAHHMGMRVCGISCISNLAAGLCGKPLSHSEVQESVDQVARTFQKLVAESVVGFSA